MRMDNCCLDEDELPVRHGLRPIRKLDSVDDFGDSEVGDREEFIRCYLRSQFESLDQIPVVEPDSDFFVENFEESAFNTHDFQKDRKPFDNYHYKIKKVLERVEDLAILHSCISSEDGRRNTRQRYELLVEVEFRDKVLELVGMYKRAYSSERCYEIKRCIALLNQRILECENIWRKHN